jgi:hypothetical protein
MKDLGQIYPTNSRSASPSRTGVISVFFEKQYGSRQLNVETVPIKQTKVTQWIKLQSAKTLSA